MNWFLKALRNYAGFSGRSRRKEYWLFTLFCYIFGIGTAILDNVMGSAIYPLPYGYITMLFFLFLFIPSLAVTVRRLHDTSRSGWFILIALIPIVGAIWLLVLMCLDSTPGENEFGPNPKGYTDTGASLDSNLVQ